MSDSFNPYMKDALRVEHGEICWGKEDCSTCNGRGWECASIYDEECELDLIHLRACDCSPAETPEDKDRLDERLFLLANFWIDEDAFFNPEDAN
jgi:hypothetical protein